MLFSSSSASLKWPKKVLTCPTNQKKKNLVNSLPTEHPKVQSPVAKPKKKNETQEKQIVNKRSVAGMNLGEIETEGVVVGHVGLDRIEVDEHVLELALQEQRRRHALPARNLIRNDEIRPKNNSETQ